jgi:hypothetical protein
MKGDGYEVEINMFNGSSGGVADSDGGLYCYVLY